MTKEKIDCRTPAEGRDGVTRIPKWKYDLVRGHLLKLVAEHGASGMPFADMKDALKKRLSTDEAAKLGSPGWHVTVVKLNMEVEGEVKRLPGKGPQRVTLG